MPTLGIDIETYSDVDLIKSGIYAYVDSPNFKVLLIAYSLDGGPVRLMDVSDYDTFDPEEFRRFTEMLIDPLIVKTAYNANFERTCLAKFIDLPMPAEQWECTMVLAANLGLPGSLEQVGAVLGLDRQKMSEGKALINYFSKPCKPTKSNNYRTRNLPGHDPAKWELFKRYCIRDVEVEQQVRNRLIKYKPPKEEQRAWVLDQHINDRGIAVDPQLIMNAIRCDQIHNERLIAEATELTGLENPNSVTQLKQWLEEAEGIEIESLSKKSVPDLIKNASSETTARVLEIRQELAKTSVKKFEAMERTICSDGRIRGLLQFYGANRTGRWAGRLVQVQNLPQNKIPDLAQARELVRNGEFELLELAYGSPAFVLSQLIRTAFIPSPDHRFIVADFSAIEARVIAWYAGEKWVLDEFEGPGKIYEATAAAMFGVDKSLIVKGNPEYALRQKGKVATLACGYQGGPNALIQMGALNMGLTEEELPNIVSRWRAAHPHIVEFWYDVEAAAVAAIEGVPQKLQYNLKFFVKDGYLFIQLPSGRRLAYAQPELCRDDRFDKVAITYMGIEQSKWAKQKTYGGKLVENIVQATARDILRDAMLLLDKAGYKIVMHVHDEVVLDVPNGFGSREQVEEIMSITPAWAPGLPLRAASFECDFYMKD